MPNYTDDELRDGIKKVITPIIEQRLWHAGKPISILRDILKQARTGPLDYQGMTSLDKAAIPKELKGVLESLDQPKWEELVESLDLKAMFPDARPE